MNDVYISPTFELYHFGIKGMKWGLRRYQNEDGSLTPEGRRHYGYGDGKRKRLFPSYDEMHEAIRHPSKRFNAKYVENGQLNEAGYKKYASDSTKRYKKVHGENAKSYKLSKQYDKKIAEEAQKIEVGDLLLNPLSPSLARTYNMARAAGYSQMKSFGKAILDVNLTAIGSVTLKGLAMKESAKAWLYGKERTSAALDILGGVGVYVLDAGLGKKELSYQQQSLRRDYIHSHRNDEI